MPTEVASLRKESPVALLELRLKEWMVQQPEWLLIVNMPRQQRRAAMKELANRLYTIPTMDGVNTVPRQVRRKAAKQLAHAAMTGQLTEQVQEALLEASRLDEEARSVNRWVGERALADEAPEAAPDPEGDIKADVEKAKDAESLIEQAMEATRVTPEEAALLEKDLADFEGNQPVVGFIETDETAPAIEVETEE